MEGKNRGKRTCAVNVESWQSGSHRGGGGGGEIGILSGRMR